MALARSLDALCDLEEIKQCKARYFRLIDMKLWDELADVFTDDVRANFNREDLPPIVGPQDTIATLRRIEPPVSIHHGHTPEIDLTSATTATGVWQSFSMRALTEQIGERDRCTYGLYWEDYRKGDDGVWRISSIRFQRLHRQEL
ncbi:MAG TPA: nuclear transport factor 2 family protein [Ilumatobacteraceae bacterium]|jgi:hypothetical protein